MLVKFKAMIGFGWIVDKETAIEFNRATNHLYEKDIRPIDGFNKDSRYFIGDIVAEVSEYEATPLGLIDQHLIPKASKWTQIIRDANLENVITINYFGTHLMCWGGPDETV
jgi:hypothetical protein